MRKKIISSTSIIFLTLLSVCLTAFLSGCKSSDKSYLVFESIAFDTTVTVTIRPQADLDHTAIFEKISDQILAIEKATSIYLSDSELSQLNQNGTLEASPELIKILQLAIHAGDQTQGIFDVSIQPLWDFHQDSSRFSSIEDALQLVDYQNIRIEDTLVSISPNMKLSFNGFIQGYVTDAIFQILTDEGVNNALINGGEYRAIGQDFQSPWTVVITGEGGQEIAEFELGNTEALAVTAGYGYIFTNNPAEPSHLFDPRNQKKINKSTTYVVRSTNATSADIFATVAALVDQKKWNEIAPPHIDLFTFE